MDKWLRVTALAFAASIATGCARQPFSRKPARTDVLRIPINVQLASLDPALVTDEWSIEVVQNTFEGLVAMGEDNRVHGCLAKSWTVSSDGLTYTFQLMPGVLFQNGRVLVAEDVKRSFERACGKKLASSMAAAFLSDISGFEAFHTGRTSSLSGIKVVSPDTVAIHIDAPRAYFLAKLTCPVASIVDLDSIKDGVHIKNVEEMVGTGPFRVESYSEDQMLVQTAFRRYHGSPPVISELQRPVMLDASSRLAAYKRGEVDSIQQITRSDYLSLLHDSAYRDQLSLSPRATLLYLSLDARQVPDRAVRQAIAMAIDRDVIAQDTLFSTVTSARGILPPQIPGYRKDPLWLAPNLETAKRLLAQSGHAGGTGLPSLRISFPMENPDLGRIADQIGSQLREKLGIRVDLDRMDAGTFIDRQNRGELQCEVSGWFADYIDPQDFLSMLLMSTSPENHWHYSNARVDAYCGEADGCLSEAKRLGLYAKAEDLALQDAVLIPIAYWKTPSIVNPRVHGIRSSAAEVLPYNQVWLETQN